MICYKKEKKKKLSFTFEAADNLFKKFRKIWKSQMIEGLGQDGSEGHVIINFQISSNCKFLITKSGSCYNLKSPFEAKSNDGFLQSARRTELAVIGSSTFYQPLASTSHQPPVPSDHSHQSFNHSHRFLPTINKHFSSTSSPIRSFSSEL